MKYKIVDWAGNLIEEGFHSFDDADSYLCQLIADLYPNLSDKAYAVQIDEYNIIEEGGAT